MNFVIGIWCGAGTRMLTRLPYAMSLFATTRGLVYCLLPEDPSFDHLEPEIAELGAHIRRTHSDERVAMRDLVAQFSADAGILTYAHCNVLRATEVRLARARIEHGWEKYETTRIKAYPAKTWLGFGDTDEFTPWDGTS